MGQIKNIKLHIVTDIKASNKSVLNNSNNGLQHLHNKFHRGTERRGQENRPDARMAKIFQQRYIEGSEERGVGLFRAVRRGLRPCQIEQKEARVKEMVEISLL